MSNNFQNIARFKYRYHSEFCIRVFSSISDGSINNTIADLVNRDEHKIDNNLRFRVYNHPELELQEEFIQNGA